MGYQYSRCHLEHGMRVELVTADDGFITRLDDEDPESFEFASFRDVSQPRRVPIYMIKRAYRLVRIVEPASPS